MSSNFPPLATDPTYSDAILQAIKKVLQFVGRWLTLFFNSILNCHVDTKRTCHSAHKLFLEYEVGEIFLTTFRNHA